MRLKQLGYTQLVGSVPIGTSWLPTVEREPSGAWTGSSVIGGCDRSIGRGVADAVSGVDFGDDLAEPGVGQWVGEEDEGTEEPESRRPETDQASDREQGDVALLRCLGGEAAKGEGVAGERSGDSLRAFPEEGVDRVRGAFGPFSRLGPTSVKAVQVRSWPPDYLTRPCQFLRPGPSSGPGQHGQHAGDVVAELRHEVAQELR